MFCKKSRSQIHLLDCLVALY